MPPSAMAPAAHRPAPGHRGTITTLARRMLAGLACLAAVQAAQGASAVHKCIVGGSVTFQSTPCAVDKPARRPTPEELNAERRKRQADTAAPAASAPAAALPAPPREPGFRCDGRQYCSQMRSCAEARYFLTHCPDTHMDGNRDGVPCEQQWCTHPLAR